MRDSRAQQSVLAAMVIVLTGLSGCGGSSTGGAASRSASTSSLPRGGVEPLLKHHRRKHFASIALSSPAITRAGGGVGMLGRDYTCDGADRSPALSWHGVPSNSAELVLFVINLKPVKHELFVDWAVAGLNPKSSGLQTGRLQPGAVVGRNGFGHAAYSICPRGAARERYVFALYAPTKHVAAQPGFEPLALRAQVLSSSRGDGLLVASYARG
jgi:phosphatidylethanolamine-binding protein (PEBP) family uncharacterized protein